MTARVVVCSFSSGLDEMKRKDQADPLAVLRMLKERGRFSAFEAASNPVIARTVTDLFHRHKWIRDAGGEYPWTVVALTEAGEKALGRKG